ncbi:hypothetical protein Hanom_Chr09g00796041 [Helianthus anomalus]
MVRTRHVEVTAELAWSGSGSRNEITPAVGRTVRYPPPPYHTEPKRYGPKVCYGAHVIPQVIIIVVVIIVVVIVIVIIIIIIN